ncbi:hypothetical protein Val02_06760 [Virgisporangium aliadipatigenens]|uniref:MFS transporter n=1 Tax=Virgisporangium aliadipatigenens TaxID=741659 RepID=A0A8J3YGU4_9ACTN|nr:hypothetical protein [Virgisporangium aliadipatigenens]GIJ43790.1 hypothetical protein Val02_06760 [Virgisporangium aliadipatigenens]
MTTDRLRELRFCGLVDSFGLSLGWTVFVLLAVRRGGLPEAAAYNAAMLVGVVLSAPVTGWLTRRMNGGPLLRLVSLTEAALRLATIAGLLAGAPTPLIAAGVAVMYLAGYSGYAVMRAEVAAVEATARAMTGYVMTIAAIEAAGAGAAALLPGETVPLWVVAVYVLSLLPAYLSARRARVVATPTPGGTARVRLPVWALCGGAGIALLATGPTLLAVALAAELHGQVWVAGAAAAFSVGCLCSSWAVEAVGRLRLPQTVGWPLWGVGMLAGWTVAAWHPVALLVAQFMAGLCMTAFEGEMDSRVAERTRGGAVTRVLAWAASTRALGSALAVRLLPVVVTAQTVGYVAGAGTSALLVCGALVAAGFHAGVHSARAHVPAPGGAPTRPPLTWPEPARAESARRHIVRPQPARPKPVRPGSAQPGLTWKELAADDAAEATAWAGSGRIGSAWQEPSPPEPVRPIAAWATPAWTPRPAAAPGAALRGPVDPTVTRPVPAQAGPDPARSGPRGFPDTAVTRSVPVRAAPHPAGSPWREPAGAPAARHGAGRPPSYPAAPAEPVPAPPASVRPGSAQPGLAWRESAPPGPGPRA